MDMNCMRMQIMLNEHKMIRYILKYVDLPNFSTVAPYNKREDKHY